MEKVKKIKIVVVGGANVGKTTLINKYINPNTLIDAVPTIQLAIISKEITFENTTYQVEICDTAGQERFQSICPNFYRGADGGLIVFDVTSYQSFQKVGDWLAEFGATMPETFCTVIVGNKVDLNGNRAVTFHEASQYASRNFTTYFDASAVRGDGVEYAFLHLIQKCIEGNSKNADVVQNDEPETVNLNDTLKKDETGNKQNKCC